MNVRIHGEVTPRSGRRPPRSGPPALLALPFAGDVQRRLPDLPPFDGDDRFLEPERGERTGGAESVRKVDRRPLELGRKPEPVHRVDPPGGPRTADPRRRIRGVRERDDVAVSDPEGSIGVAGGGPVAGGDPVAEHVGLGVAGDVRIDGNVDGGHVPAAGDKRAGDRRTVADPDLQEAIVSGEFGHERTT